MCTPTKQEVVWTLDEKFMNKIYNSIRNDKYEIAGKILFKDIECKNGVCNKIIDDYTIKNGNKSSVYTPYGIINFHTHPASAYKGENAKYGWPSGEDMGQCLEFADIGSLVHLVFTLEGTYVINVMKTNINKKQRQILEDVLKMTHIFRTGNQNEQLKNFKEFLNKPTSRKITTNIWLDFVNNLTLKELYKIYNSFNNTKLKIPENTDQIFNVQLVKNEKIVKFKAFFVNYKCHYKSFYG